MSTTTESSKIALALSRPKTIWAEVAKQLIQGSVDHAACQLAKAGSVSFPQTSHVYIAEFDDSATYRYNGPAKPPTVHLNDASTPMLHCFATPVAEQRALDPHLISLVYMAIKHPDITTRLYNLLYLLSTGYFIPHTDMLVPNSRFTLHLRTDPRGLPLFITVVAKPFGSMAETVWSVDIPDKDDLFERITSLACWAVASQTSVVPWQDNKGYLLTNRVLFYPKGDPNSDDNDPKFIHIWPYKL